MIRTTNCFYLERFQRRNHATKRSTNSESTKQRIEGVRKIADEDQRAPTSENTSNYTATVQQSELTKTRERLECSSRKAGDRSLKSKETKEPPPMPHRNCESLNTEPSRDASNRHFVTNLNKHLPNLSVEQCEHPIEPSTLCEDKSVYWIFHFNNFQWRTLAYQKVL